jgi:hypothetical protein
MLALKKDTEVIVLVGPFVDKDNPAVAETSLALAAFDGAEIVKHQGGARIDISGRTFSHITDGWYNITLTSTDTNTAGVLTLLFRDESAFLPCWRQFMVMKGQTWDSLYSTDILYADVKEYASDATGVSVSSTNKFPKVALEAINDSTTKVDSLETAISTSNNVVAANSTYINSNATAAANAATAFASLDSTMNIMKCSVAGIDGNATAATNNKNLAISSPSFTVVAGVTPSTTAFKWSLTESTNDHWNGRLIVWVTGNLAGQSVTITDFVGSTLTVTTSTMTEAPGIGDTGLVIGGGG